MNTHASARLKLTASMVIFGTLGIFTRNIAVSSGELALYRAALRVVRDLQPLGLRDEDLHAVRLDPGEAGGRPPEADKG